MGVRLAGVVLAAVLILAGCQVPPAPGPQVESVELLAPRQFIPSVVTGVGPIPADPVCPVLDGSRGWNGGPWADAHKFPRLAASEGNYSPSEVTTDRLEQTSLYDVVFWVTSRPYWNNKPNTPVSDGFSALRALNPNIKIVAYGHSYMFRNGGSAFSTEYHPTVAEVYQVIDTANGSGGSWWLADSTGRTVPQSPLNDMINWSSVDPNSDAVGRRFTQWFGDYLTSDAVLGALCGGVPCWDGLFFETMPMPHSMNGAQWNLERDGYRDQYVQGRRWMSLQFYSGWADVMERMKERFPEGAYGGEEFYLPGVDGFDDPPEMTDSAQIAVDSRFPIGIYYRTDCASASSACPASPPDNNWWSFHMRQYVNWMDDARRPSVYVVFADYLVALAEHSFYGPFFPNTPSGSRKYQRFVLASTLLDNGYATLGAGQTAFNWCDECGVWDGRTVRDVRGYGRDWMGCPLDVARTPEGQSMRDLIDSGQWASLDNNAWVRVFENAFVAVNPTTQPVTVAVPSGFKKVAGWYDPAHNNGSTVSSLVLGPMESYILVRA